MGLLEGNVAVEGHLSAGTMTIPASTIYNAAIHADAAIVRTKLAQESLAEYPVNPVDWRVWDAFQTNLPGTSAADDLGLYGGTFATAYPMLKTYDVKNAGAVTLYARIVITLPPEYQAAETVVIRVRGGMLTTVASVSATADLQVYRADEDGGISADLCTTSATTINALANADIDFTITATTLNPGDQLDVRLAVAVNDSGTGTAVIAEIPKVSLMCDIRG